MRVIVNPDSRQQTAPYYVQNTTVRFTYKRGKMLFVPGTFNLVGKRAIYSTGTTAVTAGDEIYVDPDVGVASCFQAVQWSFAVSGTQENILQYPNIVKKYTLLRQDEESIGLGLRSSMQLKCPNAQQSQAYALGVLGRPVAADNAFVDFCHPLTCGLNLADSTFSSDVNGDLILDVLLESNGRALFGTDLTAASSYSIKDLRLEFEVIPDDGERKVVQYTKHIFGEDQLLSNIETLTNTVADPCIGFLTSFVNQASLNTIAANNLLASPPIGRPPQGSTTIDNYLSYGLEQAVYAIGNVNTALTEYQLLSREEIIGNALAAAGNMDKYGTLIRKMRHPLNPDGYVIGYNWKMPMNLNANSLTMILNSRAGAPNPTYQVYTHYLCQGFFPG
jgi:hypothetical protein